MNYKPINCPHCGKILSEDFLNAILFKNAAKESARLQNPHLIQRMNMARRQQKQYLYSKMASLFLRLFSTVKSLVDG
ncbi:MAG: hypothetical protein GX799_05745 [Crenarchaeota archaeon]|nr:hypothetical protein [Thermoproteota archaeon]